MSRLKNAEIKSRILQASMKLFGQYGYKKTTVDEIAREAKIGKGTVYLHFRTKEDIVCALARENAEKGIIMLTRAVSELGDPVSKLRLILKWRPERVYNFRKAHQHAFDIMPVLKKEIRKKIGAGPMQKYIRLIEEVLREGNRKGVFSVRDPGAMARHVNFMGFAFMPPYRIHETRKEILAQVDMYADMLLESIRN
jgi:AcrR family transcriptional regulator